MQMSFLLINPVQDIRAEECLTDWNDARKEVLRRHMDAIARDKLHLSDVASSIFEFLGNDDLDDLREEEVRELNELHRRDATIRCARLASERSRQEFVSDITANSSSASQEAVV
jgi:hypothetical protein